MSSAVLESLKMPIKPPPAVTSMDMLRARGGATYTHLYGERARRQCAAVDLDRARQIVGSLPPLEALSREDAELVARRIAQCFATGREQVLRLVSPDLDWGFEARLAKRHVRTPG